MISKELLSEVLKVEIYGLQTCKGFVQYTTKVEYKTGALGDSWFDSHHINIHELAHKCKEGAYEKGYSSSIDMQDFGDKGSVKGTWYVIALMERYNYGYIGEYSARTEPEAIFKACQWILEHEKTN